MGDEVLKLFEETKSILKIDRAHRDNEKNQKNINLFKKLKTTMKFGPEIFLIE